MGWTSVLQALWLFLPAYVANMSPVFTARMMPWWKAPIDGGRVHKDGQRVMGDGKTWRGLAGGGLFGGLAAMAVALLAPAYHERGVFAGWDFGHRGYAGGTIGHDGISCIEDVCTSVDAVATPLWVVFLFGFVVGSVALVGDAFESFLKRRKGHERGAPWIPFDQLDFVVFGLLGMLLAAPLLPDGWVFQALFGDWVVLVTLIVGTPLLHLLVNRIGYWLKLKEVPW